MTQADEFYNLCVSEVVKNNREGSYCLKQGCTTAFVMRMAENAGDLAVLKLCFVWWGTQ